MYDKFDDKLNDLCRRSLVLSAQLSDIENKALKLNKKVRKLIEDIEDFNSKGAENNADKKR